MNTQVPFENEHLEILAQIITSVLLRRLEEENTATGVEKT